MYTEKTKIVIIDDNKDILIILCDYFSEFDDFEIVGTAENGLDGINIIIEKEPDVVIMDIVMPHLDGIGVLEKMKNIQMERKPQFIMLSAIGQDKSIQIALSLGAVFFIVKPFNLNDLILRIRQLKSLNYIKNSNNINCNMNDIILHEIPPKNYDVSVVNVLDEIGIPSHLKGYEYLKCAIIMVLGDLSALNSIAKTIYSHIADKYTTTPTRVERDIRNAIEIGCCKGNVDYINSLFSSKINDIKLRPSNSEFITIIVEQLK